MHRFTSLISLTALFAGCAITESGDDVQCEGGKCDGGEDRCYAEARYNDGTCDAECPEADIDCFVMFDDQAQASSWFAQLETRLATSESRAPRALIPPSDARFTRMRELLDRGWASYQKHMPVGMIDQPPELVVIDDPTANAFVARDLASNKAAWVVMVQTGAMENQPDHSLLGVVMHELTHATKLHVLPGTGDRVRIHYQTTSGKPEPLGYKQKDDPRAREAITAWRALGEDAGAYAYAELHGMPAPGSLLSAVLNAAVAKADLSRCDTTVTAVNALSAFMAARTSPLTNLLEVSTAADKAELSQLTHAFLTDVRDVCLAGSTLDVFQLMAEQFGVTPAQVAERFPVAEQAAIAGKHVIDQITYLAGDRHRRMREVAALLQQETGRDITTLRYFSTEEAADDSTVPVMRDMGMPVDSVGQFFIAVMPEATRNQCTALLDANTTPPYGDLVDEHHAVCWRVAHVQQLGAATGPQQGYSAPLPETPTSSGAYRAIAGEQLPRWRRASDDISNALH